MEMTKENIQKLLDQGRTKKEIAVLFGKKRETFSHYLRKFGLTTPKNLFSDEELDLLRKFYPVEDNEILLRRFKGRTVNSLRAKAVELGLHKKEHKMRVPKSNLAKLLNGSLESNYWIGYLLADGNITKKLDTLILSAAVKDKEQIKKYANFIETKNIYYRKGASGFSNNPTFGVSVVTQDSINVKKISNAFNFLPRKTQNPPNTCDLDFLTTNQLVSLFIGYVDGDGTIVFNSRSRNYHVSTYGSKEWDNFHNYLGTRLKEHFIEFNFKVYSRKIRTYTTSTGALKRRKPSSTLRICSKKLLQSLKSFIEEHNLPVLERKWDKVVID